MSTITQHDARLDSPEGRVMIAAQNTPAIPAAERAMEHAQSLLADARTKLDATLAAAKGAGHSPAARIAYFAASAEVDLAAARLDVARSTLAMERAAARRNAWQVEQAAAEAEAATVAAPEPTTARCHDCEAPLENMGSGQWVDARSGDDGGTYDICPAQYDEATDTQHGHCPV